MESNSHVSKTCIALVASLVFALGCSGEDEKPRPDFMSKPDSSRTPTAPGADVSKRPSDSAAPHTDIAVQPATPRSRDDDNEPTLQDDDTRTPMIVIVDGRDSERDDFDDDAPEGDAQADDFDGDDDLAQSDEDEEEDEKEEPREEDGTFYYGSTRPFIPPPLDTVDPSPVDDIDVAAPPAPSASQLAKATEPWMPTPQSELERILDQENVEITPEEHDAMRRLDDIPSPRDPNPQDHP